MFNPQAIDKNCNGIGLQTLYLFKTSAVIIVFLDTEQLLQFLRFLTRTYRWFYTNSATFMQLSSYNFTIFTKPERSTFLIVISCGNFNIARDRNTLLGSEILSPLNRRLQCERVRMRLIRDVKIVFDSLPSILCVQNSVSSLNCFVNLQ